MTQAAITLLLQEHGLQILFGLTLIEGPIATVVAATLASKGYLNPWLVCGIAILGDIAGDLVLYGIGRFCPVIVRPMLRSGGLPGAAGGGGIKVAFRQQGAQLLILGKLTHVAGFAVILAAGGARMGLGRFILLSVIATVPKVLVLVGIGYGFDRCFAVAGLGQIFGIVIAVCLLAALCLTSWRRRCA